jgi:hypothetical protein
MIRGLLRHESITNFRLNLDVEVTWEDEVCFGSAATLTLIELLDYSFVPSGFKSDFSRAVEVWTDQHDLVKFETAIVLFSKGFPKALAEYFGVPSPKVVDFGWKLENHNLEIQLPRVTDFWETLSRQSFRPKKRSICERWEMATKRPVFAAQ